MIVPMQDREAERLEALARYRILDTPAEPDFDEVATLASILCSTPIAAVSLVDSRRLWFKSRIGIELTEAPRDHSFCTHVVLQDKVFEVQDATADERFERSAMVVDDPSIRYYAGMPVRANDGHAIGTLCVMDRRPRRLSRTAHEALAMLAHQVERLLQVRVLQAEVAHAMSRVHTVHGLLPVCMYCRKIRDDEGSWQRIENYVRAHTELEFSHGVCSECLERHYSDVIGPVR